MTRYSCRVTTKQIVAAVVPAYLPELKWFARKKNAVAAKDGNFAAGTQRKLGKEGLKIIELQGSDDCAAERAVGLGYSSADGDRPIAIQITALQRTAEV